MEIEREPLDCVALAKELADQPGEWKKFYIQPKTQINRRGDRYARNRANTLRMFAQRKELPIEVTTQRELDGCIHCWARWIEEEGGESSPPIGQ